MHLKIQSNCVSPIGTLILYAALPHDTIKNTEKYKNSFEGQRSRSNVT